MTDETTNATPAQSLTMNLLAAHVSIDAPHYKQSRFYNFPTAIDSLFSTPVSHADNYQHYLSALSPAAYLVDLMRLLEKHIPKNDLQDRRPDLWELQLDREHTDELVPFLEIVNNVLAMRLTKDTPQAGGLTEQQKQETRRKLARSLLATATYPFTLPVHLPLLEIRAYLAHFDVELADVYETFQVPLGSDAWVAETLGLSPLEFKALGASNAKSLAEAYGLPTGTSLDQLNEVPTFLQQTGLTPNELTELMSVAQLSLVLEANPQRIEPLDDSVWDYLNRMIRLSRRLSWSFSDLGLVLPAFPRKANWQKSLRELAQVKSLSEKYKLPVDVLRSLVGAMNTTPGFAAEGKSVRDSLFDRVFNTPPFYHPPEAKYSKYHPRGVGGFADSHTEALLWNSQDEPDAGNEKTKKNHGIRTSLLAALHVGNDDLQTIVDHLCSDDTEKKLDPHKVKLDVPTLTRFYRLSKTAQVLGMDVTEYLLLIKCINREGDKPVKSAAVPSLDDLRKVGQWAEWLKDSGLSAYQLDYLTTGTLSDEARHRFDAGPTDEQLAASLPDLKPWLMQPQSFAQGTISTKAADDIYKALFEAMIVDANGLCRTTTKPSDVVKALAKSNALPLSADELKQDLGKTGVLTGTSLDQTVTSILAKLQVKGILDNALNLAVDTPLDSQTDLSFLHKDPTHLEDPEDKTIATVSDLLVRKAGDIRAITDIVNRYQEQQVQLTVTQLAENFHQDSHLVSSALDYLKIALPAVTDTVTRTGGQGLRLLLYLAKAMNLTADVFDALLKNPSLFSTKSSPSIRSFSIETLRRVHAFSSLVKAFGKQGSAGEKTAAQLAIFAWGPADGNSSDLSKLSGWEESQLKPLQTHLAQMGVPGVNHNGGVSGVSCLTVMRQCFDLAAKLGVDIQTLIRLCPPLPSHAAKKQAGLIFDDYSAAAHSLLAVVKSKYTTDEWEKVFGPIRDRLNERERDALATLTLQSLRQTHPDKKFDSLQDLSGFLLIDVEMGGCTKASYILEAISCLQTYIERWRMHLEDGINLPPNQPSTDASTTPPPAEPTTDATAIPDSLWAWMCHYRIWEANRKVFFYPENYLEPSQRQNATPLFRELQSELLQGNITDEAVTDAYINYFDKLDELASLQIVDAHLASVMNPKTGDNEETLFIVGRTSSDPPIFYLRNAVLDESKQEYRGWTPWEKIDLTIPVQEVTALYAFNRLYIFWIETKEKKEGTSEAGKKKTITKEGTVKYSYQKVSGRWLQAQVLDQTIKVVWDDGAAEPPHDDTTLSVTSDNQTTILVQGWSIRQYKIKGFEQGTIKRIPGAEDVMNNNLILLPFAAVDFEGGTKQQTLDMERGTIVNEIEFGRPAEGQAMTYDVILYGTVPEDAGAPRFSSQGETIETGGVWGRYLRVGRTFPSILNSGIPVVVRGLRVGNTITTVISSDGEDFIVRSTKPDLSPAPAYTCQRLTTHAVHKIREDLMNGGLDQLLSLSAQGECQKQPASPPVPRQFLINPSPKTEDRLDFDAGDPYAIYYREIFFHIPFLIADTLNKNQQFEHARKWYHYILDPTRPLDNSKDENGMWRFLPFRGHTIDKLKEVLDDEAYHDELAEDAFDPDAIAQARLGAYEKAVAMKYLDNLLGWGDMLFTQDSWEAINQAALLYVHALNLLGPKPNPQHLALPPAVVPKIPIGESKKLLVHAHQELIEFTPTARSKYVEPFDNVPDFFCLPENDEFAGYWDRTQDCLYKIRHCMNIAGVVRQLALFEVPIDPRQFILAGAGGQDVNTLAPVPVPHYRFSVMLQQAKNLTATVIQLGSALLTALEKKDAEDLNLLRSTQEQAILNLMRSIKEKQIEDGAKHLESLGHSLDGAKYRQEHYSGLIDGRYSEAEKANLSLDAAALTLQVSAAPLKGISIGGHLIPTIFGLADGGMKPGDALMVAGQLVESAAMAAQQGAGMAATIAQLERRREDWELQQSLATYDVQQIQAEIDGATIRQAIMERDLEIHDQSVEQAQARDDFYRRKFGTSDLYQWMAGRLATVYFQTYKLALDVARSAEKAYQYERNTDATMITPGFWDSLKKGLLAGEGLMLALSQIERAYMDDHSRELEIEKTISLFQRDNNLVSDLKKNGTCKIMLDETLFHDDFPNHYCRKIKSIAITIPAVVGPYQNINATLKQTSNRVLLKPDKAGRDFLLGTANAPTPPADMVRSDWRPQQQIAISRAVDDSGMFQLDFRDERYLPFEGTGAVSEWELKMPKNSKNEDLINSISDVIIHLRYTALDGGDGLK